ncbi:Type 1 glutamine amidotransferase-like domain-containing protein [Candidatus Woesearchaeota archaeon]|nr:Type 1 glutamine amidotransferase-like domain-containing protein [Candidatus Woesearchaeota archaeon]
MAKIFLGGGGSTEQSKRLDSIFVKQVGRKPILYIPVAMETSDFQPCWDWFIETFSALGIRKERIVMWTNLEGKTVKDLMQFSAVYIGGGNTFKLLKLMRKSGFDKALKQYAKKGIIYGGSAGAIILGKSIKTAIVLDENNEKLEDLNGLCLVNYSIFCHYKPELNNRIMDLAKQLDIIAITEESGLIVSEKIQVVGKAFLFTKKCKQPFI